MEENYSISIICHSGDCAEHLKSSNHNKAISKSKGECNYFEGVQKNIGKCEKSHSQAAAEYKEESTCRFLQVCVLDNKPTIGVQDNLG